VALYTIFVSVDGGPYTPWLTRTTQTSATYTGAPGHTYRFYSVATDNVGHQQATPATAQATTTISSYTITPHASAGGRITPDTPQPVNFNATVGFTITPDNGYRINTVTGCGGSLNGATYTTGPITGNCTVSATFALTGDVDKDTTINVFDALLTLQYAVGLIPHTPQNNAMYLVTADVAPLGATGKPEGDGSVNVFDALAILRYAVGLDKW
jgi:hypothetical protein